MVSLLLRNKEDRAVFLLTLKLSSFFKRECKCITNVLHRCYIDVILQDIWGKRMAEFGLG